MTNEQPSPGEDPVDPERPDAGPEGQDDRVYGDHRWRAAILPQLRQYVIATEGPEHRVVFVNAAILRVLGGFNPVGLRLVDFLEGVEGQGLIEIYDRAHAGQETVLRRTRYVVSTPEGYQDEIVIDFEINPLRGPAGEIVGAVGTGRDSTALAQREEADAAAAADLTQRYRRATDVIEEVQRALLPARLPVLPGLQLAASYVVGGAEQAAGGDWFDVLPRPDGRVAAVVGDVVGHGVSASAVMSQLRAVALERLHAGADPVEVVSALDRFTQVVPAAASATVCVLVLDPRDGTVQHCSAGHPPPLVVPGRGPARFLDPGGAPPLHDPAADVARGAPGREAQHTVLDPGELVLLYTDGIVERPGVPATTGTVDLARAAAAAAADELVPAFSLPTAVERVAVQTLERLTRITGSSDDITLLALHPVAVLVDLRVQADIGRADVPDVRARLRDWLGARQVAVEAVDRLDEVVSELCENAVEHAYDDDPGPVEVDAHLDELGTVTLTVTDRGRWRPPPPLPPAAGRGLGLAIVQSLSDRLQVEPLPRGTRITVTFRPWTTPHGTVALPPRAEAETFDVYTEDRGDVSITTVRGPVDVLNVAELDGELALRTVPGSPPLTVHLERVSVLSSAAVHVIRHRLEQAGTAGVPVRLVSGPGTIADHVLALVGLGTDSVPGRDRAGDHST